MLPKLSQPILSYVFVFGLFRKNSIPLWKHVFSVISPNRYFIMYFYVFTNKCENKFTEHMESIKTIIIQILLSL